MAYFIGVDVGTGSVRAALVNDSGKIIKRAIKTIQTWNPQPDFYEQSSQDIWTTCLECIKGVIEGVKADDIQGIGFDATCSLVVLDKSGDPLSVSPTGDNNQNVILWLDHRASKEADEINKLNHSVLKFVGGRISLEMQTPKLVWLKRNRQEWKQIGFVFDLPDFLTWKATDCDSRSLCSLVCKWTFEISLNGEGGWNSAYFDEIGLVDLKEDDWRKIGRIVHSPGEPVGRGLSKRVALELGLNPGMPVGTSIIDAHAGGLGLIGCSITGIDSNFNTRLCLICGTSTCHMAVSKEPIFVPGVWGPYYSAMVPGMWLNEGGQSATGKLIDHIIDTHPATVEIRKRIGDMHIQTYLSNLLSDIAKKRRLQLVDLLTKDLHVWPDFHGNRSPFADPTLRGNICGLSLAQDEENLAILYLATIQALAYGTRQILETLIESGYESFESLLICGGLSKNSLFIRTQADVVGLPVLCPEESESVLLGAAILGACAAGYFANMETAIKSMGGNGKIVHPNPEVIDYHNKKYRVFLQMLKNQYKYRKLME